MGRNSQTRRAAKAKARAKQRARAAHDHRSAASEAPDAADWFRHDGPPPPGRSSAEDHAREASTLWWLLSRPDASGETTALANLRRLHAIIPETTAHAAEAVLLDHLDNAWAHGWQPAELLRQARLGTRSRDARSLLERAVAVDHAGRGPQRIDPRWQRQIEEAGLQLRETPASGWSRGWLCDENDDAAPSDHGLHTVLDALRCLARLPLLDVLIPPPGRPSAPTWGPGDAVDVVADPVLKRVRALLAKAESTEFDAEATALTAKAHELITRHAIDQALLAASAAPGAERPGTVRLFVDPPYADVKALLLQTVAEATRSRAVSMGDLAMSSVVGRAADLAAVEALYTSLLVQAHQALAEAARQAPPGARPRTQSYRSAFLMAFTRRVGERLAETNEHVFAEAAGDAERFLPVLRALEDTLDDYVTERFGELSRSSVRAGYDSSGWARGRMAGDAARLAAGDLVDAPSR